MYSHQPSIHLKPRVCQVFCLLNRWADEQTTWWILSHFPVNLPFVSCISCWQVLITCEAATLTYSKMFDWVSLFWRLLGYFLIWPRGPCRLLHQRRIIHGSYHSHCKDKDKLARRLARLHAALIQHLQITFYYVRRKKGSVSLWQCKKCFVLFFLLPPTWIVVHHLDLLGRIFCLVVL